MPAASAPTFAAPGRAAEQQLETELLLTAVPGPVAWPEESSAPVPLFREVPAELQRRRSDNWLAWNVGRVRPDPFAVLFERYWQQISAFCLTIVGTRDEAEDAAAEAMSRAYATLSRRGERPEFRPWIHAIARNAALDRHRQLGHEPQLAFDAGELDSATGDEPDEILGRRERLERLIGDLQALAERQRAAIVMRELSGMTYEEIAETLETSPLRAKGLVADARASLSERRDGRSIGCGEYRRAVQAGRGRVPRGQRLAAHRDACPDCRAYARPRLLNGFFFLPILELFSRAGRRIAETAGPVSGHTGSAGAAKVAAAASMVALAVPVAQQATDDPRPAPRDDATPALSDRSDASTASREAASERSTLRARRSSGAGRRERAAAPAEERSAARPVDEAAAPAAPSAGAPVAVAPQVADPVSGLVEDVQTLVEETTTNLTDQLQDAPGLVPDVNAVPGEIRVDLGAKAP